jgi:hypothetical protein
VTPFTTGPEAPPHIGFNATKSGQKGEATMTRNFDTATARFRVVIGYSIVWIATVSAIGLA